MASIRNTLPELYTLATTDDVDRSDCTDGTIDPLDITGKNGTLIFMKDDGTPGTVGIDVIVLSFDGGTTWVTAVKANIGHGHAGLLLEDGSKAAAAGAALCAAGVEPADGCSIFSLGPIPGPALLRCGTATNSEGTAADWTSGAPGIYALTY
jgi:hypothetical protein